MPNELKPCPCCGGKSKYVELYNDGKGNSRGYVRCAKVAPCVEQFNISAKKIAYQRWNRRADNA